MAANLNIAAFKRVPFGGSNGEGDLPILGVNWSGATFKMDLRASAGDTGTALVALTNASAGSQGISAVYDADYLAPDTDEPVGTTIVRIQIDEATMEGIALAARPSEPLALYYDLHVTPSGEAKRVLMFGKFTIYPGATI